jgi:hypothetical protein
MMVQKNILSYRLWILLDPGPTHVLQATIVFRDAIIDVEGVIAIAKRMQQIISSN